MNEFLNEDSLILASVEAGIHEVFKEEIDNYIKMFT